MNLSTLSSELLNRLKSHNNQVSTERITRWLNLAQDDVASDIDCRNHQFTETFSTVANQRIYNLNTDFNKINNIIDVTNNLSLSESSEFDVEVYDPDLSDLGAPTNYIIYGYNFSNNQPTAAATVSIVSTSIADTMSKVRINGTVNGVQDTELLTLNGTTTVTGLKSFSEIYTVAKDQQTSGIVTVTANDAGLTQIAKLSPYNLSEGKQPVRLYPIPGAVYTLRVRGLRKARPMRNNEDFPDFPETFHELILHKATERGHIDLFRPTMADYVRRNNYEPLKQTLLEQMGQTRGRRSAVIKGDMANEVLSIGRLPPSNFGNF